jgi:hypothetical protein
MVFLFANPGASLLVLLDEELCLSPTGTSPNFDEGTHSVFFLACFKLGL